MIRKSYIALSEQQYADRLTSGEIGANAEPINIYDAGIMILYVVGFLLTGPVLVSLLEIIK